MRFRLSNHAIAFFPCHTFQRGLAAVSFFAFLIFSLPVQCQVPAAPSITSTPNRCGAVLSWNGDPSVESYRLERSVDGGNVYVYYGSAMGGTAASLGGQFPGQNGASYHYRIRAFDSVYGLGPWSNDVIVTLNLGAPSVITKKNNDAVTFCWRVVPDADQYRMYYSTTGAENSFTTFAGTGDNSGAVNGVIEFTAPSTDPPRFYVVIANNCAGDSPPSNRVSNVPNAAEPNTPAYPPHECACPLDPDMGQSHVPQTGGLRVSGATAAGPSAGDPVNLATGKEAYTPASDLAVYNPYGPSVLWQREFRNNQARRGYGSPGFAPGWVHNYDVVLLGESRPFYWDPIKIVYPNGSADVLTPQVNSSNN